MNTETLTPLSDVYHRSQRLRVDIPFPSWVETEQIGINLPKTERLMNVGGMKHVRIVGETNGEKTIAMPTGIGIAPDGSRYAGMMGAKESAKTLSLESSLNPKRPILKNAEWTSTTIRLNLEEIQRQIEDKRMNLRKADSWTPYLDGALRWGIRKAGSEHLLTNFTWSQKCFFFFVNIHNTVLLSSNLDILSILEKIPPKIPHVTEILFWTGVNAVFVSLFEPIIFGREDKTGSGYRISLIPGYEIDRAVVLQVLSRTNKLVKTIPSQQ